MDIVKLMRLKTFFDILDRDGEEAAVRFAEETTGKKIDTTDKEKPAKKRAMRVVE